MAPLPPASIAKEDVVHDDVVAMAWKQFGAFSIEQARERGVGRSTVARALDRGVIRRRAPSVYVLSAAAPSARQDLMVEVLAAGPGALAAADSALAVWCPELIFPRRPEIVVPRSCGYRSRSAVVCRSSDLHLANPGVVDGIPVTGVARALLDASAGRSPEEVLTRIDACRRHGSLAIGALLEVLEQHSRKGRTGIATYRRALLGLRRQVTDSEFERLVVRDLVAAGVPEPRVHHLVRLPGRQPIELDLDWPGLLVDIELDGRDHVERARTMRRDRQRDRLLQAVDYVVARYTWDDYVCDRPGMLAEIAAFHTSARRAA